MSTDVSLPGAGWGRASSGRASAVSAFSGVPSVAASASLPAAGDGVSLVASGQIRLRGRGHFDLAPWMTPLGSHRKKHHGAANQDGAGDNRTK